MEQSTRAQLYVCETSGMSQRKLQVPRAGTKMGHFVHAHYFQLKAVKNQ